MTPRPYRLVGWGNGAWNASAFGNDRAPDLLNELAELDDEGRAAHLCEVFAEGIAAKDDDAPLTPEVVGASALVACCSHLGP